MQQQETRGQKLQRLTGLNEKQEKQIIGFLQKNVGNKNLSSEDAKNFYRQVAPNVPFDENLLNNTVEQVRNIRDPRTQVSLFDLDLFESKFSNAEELEIENPSRKAADEAAAYIEAGGHVLSAAPAEGFFDRLIRKTKETADFTGEGLNAGIARALYDAADIDSGYHILKHPNLTEEEREARRDASLLREVQNERQRIADFDAAEAAKDPSALGSIKSGVTDTVGYVAGDLNPFTLIGGGSTLLRRALVQGSVSAATDVAVQGEEISRGIKDNFEASRVALNFAAGAAFQGGLEGVEKATPKVFKWLGTQDPRSVRNTLPDHSAIVDLDDNIKTLEKFGVDPKRFKTPEDIKNTAETLLKEDDQVKAKLNRALRDAKPLRAEQKAEITQNRAERFAKAQEVQDQLLGEEGAFKALAELKGPLSKNDAISIRDKFTQTDIDTLFNTVNSSQVLTTPQKVSASQGLAGLLGHENLKPPTEGEQVLLGKVFGDQLLQGLKDTRPLKSKIYDATGEAFNVPRAFISTGDLSAPFRQGVFLSGRKEFWTNMWPMIRAFGSEEYASNIKIDIETRPTYSLMDEYDLAILDINGPLAKREESLIGARIVEKLPIFGPYARASNRAFTSYLNKLRADVFDDIISTATSLGNNITENPKAMQDLADYVNRATGRGNLPEFLETAGPFLNIGLFSPGLQLSRIQTLSPTTYVGMDPFVRKQALKDITKFGALATTVLTLANAGGAEVETNPTSSDFAKIKVGNTRYDILGGAQQYIRLGAMLALNERQTINGNTIEFGEGYKPETRGSTLLRFGRSKLSPSASYIVDAIEGSNYLGEEFDAAPDLMERFIPLIAQDLYENSREEGAKGFAKTLPAIVGFGVSTFGGENEKTEELKPFLTPKQQTLVQELQTLPEEELESYFDNISDKELSELEDSLGLAAEKLAGEGETSTLEETSSSIVDNLENLSEEELLNKLDNISDEDLEQLEKELFGNEEPSSSNQTTTSNVLAVDTLEGLGLTVTGKGIRSFEEQSRLYKNYSGVSKPGTSTHEFGNAVDVRIPKNMSQSKVIKSLTDRGYKGVKIISAPHGSGPHWHVQWEKGPNDE